jgi:hypothetical protein
LNTKYLLDFVEPLELEAIAPQVEAAAHLPCTKNAGLGKEFLGWLTLPRDL